ncbi:SacI homology domain-containing protein [Trichophaea hybrida]|nr:SacI homology domain-containing protein [Trichophaea hybrida]
MSPVLARKILIIAAIDGLILSPIQNSRSRSPPAKVPPGSIRVDYKTQAISPYQVNGDAKQKPPDAGEHARIEAHGIVEAKHPVYVITNIALIPLSSRKDAAHAIDRANSSRKPAVTTDDNASDTEDEGETDAEDGTFTPGPAVDDEVQDEITEVGKAAAGHTRYSSIGEDVIGKKGAYGRFAEKWFSKKGWTVDRRRSEGMSAVPETKVSNDELTKKPENQPAPPTAEGDIAQGEAAVEENNDKDPVEEKSEEVTEAVKETVTHNLTPKLLHTTKLLLAHSRSFYFSYDWDITRSWGSQVNDGNSSLPLFKIVDPLYFWNRHLQKQSIDSGQHGFILPLMQGFVAQTTFSATSTPSTPEAETETPIQSQGLPATGEVSSTSQSIGVQYFAAKDTPTPGKQRFILTLISRRSTRRAGLRYLRRGVDDQGHTANFVETEQLLSTPTWDHVFSYLQIRGSIPLYFSQSPYLLRPRPVLLRSEDSNAAAMRLHFKNVRERYGNIHIVNLVEKNGSEAIVGDKYRDSVANMNSSDSGLPQIGWTWFDFHKECRGMRFENVSCLFTEIGDVLDTTISYTEDISGTFTQRQHGVLRTNCMDCLDRTNVVQSGSARRALESQLRVLGITLNSPTTEWFNILWADNGDAISKQYASTAALKGDFTRTNKRNFQGALTDFGLTMTRYFTNIISDFFTQAAIDFLLGNVTNQVFVDFEAEMISSDPSISLLRVRQNAIEVSSKIVVADDTESFRGGWTFLSPRDPGVRIGTMVEKVLLLTDKAVYMCAFDFTLEKVSAFERVPLDAVREVQWGTYITSTLAASYVDEKRNVGFLVRYCGNGEGRHVVKVNTRSLQTTPKKEERREEMMFWAFKAMPAGTGVDAIAATDNVESEKEVVRSVVWELAKACQKVKVTEGDVVSFAEAKKGTGLVERWGYAVKRLVWA